MPSKEQMHSNDKASPKQRSPKPAAQNSAALIQQTHPATILQRAELAPSLLTPSDILQLQCTIGNQATGRLLARMDQRQSAQTKQTMNNLGDQYEQKADRMVDQVGPRISSSGTTGTVQRQPEEEEEVQMKTAATDVSLQTGSDLEGYRSTQRGSEHPLSRPMPQPILNTTKDTTVQRIVTDDGTDEGEMLSLDEILAKVPPVVEEFWDDLWKETVFRDFVRKKIEIEDAKRKTIKPDDFIAYVMSEGTEIVKKDREAKAKAKATRKRNKSINKIIRALKSFFSFVGNVFSRPKKSDATLMEVEDSNKHPQVYVLQQRTKQLGHEDLPDKYDEIHTGAIGGCASVIVVWDGKVRGKHGGGGSAAIDFDLLLEGVPKKALVLYLAAPGDGPGSRSFANFDENVKRLEYKNTKVHVDGSNYCVTREGKVSKSTAYGRTGRM